MKFKDLDTGAHFRFAGLGDRIFEKLPVAAYGHGCIQAVTGWARVITRSTDDAEVVEMPKVPPAVSDQPNDLGYETND